MERSKNASGSSEKSEEFQVARGFHTFTVRVQNVLKHASKLNAHETAFLTFKEGFKSSTEAFSTYVAEQIIMKLSMIYACMHENQRNGARVLFQTRKWKHGTRRDF